MRKRTGSIDTTRNGQHRVRITLPAQGRVTLAVCDTKEEAERERAAAASVISTDVVDVAWTVKTWGERWLKARDVGKLVVDPDSDWSRWNHHIVNDPIARVSLRMLRKKHVKAWLRRVEAKVAEQTTRNCLNVLRGLLGAALDEDLIKSNPADKLKVMKQKRTEEPWSYASPVEQYRLLVCAHEVERWVIGFAMGTGLRAGELVSLHLADVHVDGPNPHVVVRYGTPPNLPTKSGKIREVPLFGLGLLSAREWLALLPRFARKNPHGLMFPGQRGAFRDEDHVLRWAVWSDIRKAAGVDMRWHDLRHTAASSLVSGVWGRAWTLIEVRDFLGHVSVTTTERYAHLADTALKSAARETQAGSSNGLNWPRRAAARIENPERFSAEPPSRLELETYGLRSPSASPVTTGGILAEGHMKAVCLGLLVAAAAKDSVRFAELAREMGALAFANPTRAIEFAASWLERNGLPFPASAVAS